MTPIALLLAACGLSQREAAGMLGVQLDTVKSWCSGRNPTPPGALSDLAALEERIDAAVREGAAKVTALRGDPPSSWPGPINLHLARDDEEARGLGWPVAGAQRTALGRIAAAAIRDGHAVQIVPCEWARMEMPSPEELSHMPRGRGISLDAACPRHRR